MRLRSGTQRTFKSTLEVLGNGTRICIPIPAEVMSAVLGGPDVPTEKSASIEEITVTWRDFTMTKGYPKAGKLYSWDSAARTKRRHAWTPIP